MAVPQVAIVGRPNVGKSSLFNWLAGRRIAIVEPTAGVTRDRISTLIEAGGQFFELVDTGGMGIQDRDNLTEDVERQIVHAIDRAAVILFLVDGRTGPMPLDEVVVERLRQIDKPILCVVNKCDTPHLDTQTAEFYRFSKEPLILVSAQQQRGKEQLLRRIVDKLPHETSPVEEVALKLAIVGRRNTGKSTFINSLAEEERVIVSEVAGTTRDSVDVRFERDGKTYIAIDTAGLRRKSSIQDDIEFYSLSRAERSIRRADVVLMFMDVRWTISRVDKQLADYILEQHKPAIFVVNKWDLATDIATGDFADYVHKVFPNLDYVPLAFITAKTGKNIQRVVNLAQNLHKQAGSHVTTGELNRVLRQAVDANPPPLRMNRRPKIYFGTQVGEHPPTIVLFTNGPELFDNTYQRYLIKTFRDALPFHDVPIKLHVRSRHGVGEGDEPKPVTKPASRKARQPKSGPRDEGMWQNL
jgi:GTP-binding protein